MRLLQIILLVLGLSNLLGCSGCSQSGRRLSKQGATSSSKRSDAKTIIKMENENGVKYVWVEINGIRLRFIFDTGASSICISSAEATVLYKQGTLKKEDVIDVEYFQDATGHISAGTKINLSSVKIGDRLLRNIEAIVIDNEEAPLLLGQSALEKFGKISIDNKKSELTFE